MYPQRPSALKVVIIKEYFTHISVLTRESHSADLPAVSAAKTPDVQAADRKAAGIRNGAGHTDAVRTGN